MDSKTEKSKEELAQIRKDMMKKKHNPALDEESVP